MQSYPLLRTIKLPLSLTRKQLDGILHTGNMSFFFSSGAMTGQRVSRTQSTHGPQRLYYYDLYMRIWGYDMGETTANNSLLHFPAKSSSAGVTPLPRYFAVAYAVLS